MNGMVYEKLETEVEIEGIVYPVDMAFDNIMLLLEMMNDGSLSNGEKVFYGIYALLGTELEMDFDKQVMIFDKLIENFVHQDQPQEAQVDLEGNIMPTVKKKQTYDLRHDESYIYTSFRQAYQMDLEKEQGKLDWRKFKILLRDLPENTKLKQVIDIRMRDYPKGKHASDERRKLKELKRTFAIPGTLEE